MDCRGDLKPATLRHGVLVGWCGMRGLVTLATALALPANFPQRDLIVLTAFAVVLATLVVQGLTLAPLVRLLKLDGEDGLAAELAEVRADLAAAALATLEGETGRVADNWRYGFESARAAATSGDSGPLEEKRRLGLAALRRQRERLEALRNEQRVGAGRLPDPAGGARFRRGRPHQRERTADRGELKDAACGRVRAVADDSPSDRNGRLLEPARPVDALAQCPSPKHDRFASAAQTVQQHKLGRGPAHGLDCFLHDAAPAIEHRHMRHVAAPRSTDPKLVHGDFNRELHDGRAANALAAAEDERTPQAGQAPDPIEHDVERRHRDRSCGLHRQINKPRRQIRMGAKSDQPHMQMLRRQRLSGQSVLEALLPANLGHARRH